MGAYFAKQPNGLYCRFSTIVDTITHYNLTKEDVIEYYMEKAKEDAEYMLEHRLYDFERIKTDFVPNNNTVEEFDQLVKDMGDSEGLGPDLIESWKEWEKEMEEDENE